MKTIVILTAFIVLLTYCNHKQAERAEKAFKYIKVLEEQIPDLDDAVGSSDEYVDYYSFE